ncbi:hypothetical protein DFH09DRAFT_1360503 [Mycena vulgaris]|nr:hypothetical protein DFH09DRAFT_1360503 [Mycena vulgaris]
MMEPGTLVEKLSYLSKCLQEYRDRISWLEEELERVRSDTSTNDELGVSTERIRRLEAEKAALQKEVAALKEASKIKQETPKIKQEIPDVKVELGASPTRLSASSAPNTVLADARQTFKQERERNEALQAKCTNLEITVKESADLAAKAFIERAEGDKALDKMRVEATEMKRKIEDLEKTCDELNAANTAGVVLIEANEAAIGKLRVKYDNVKAEKKEMRTASEGLEAEIAAVNEKLFAVKANYKTVKIEKEDLQQTCRELVETVENLEVEVKANAGAAEILDDLGSRYNKADNDRAKLQERCISLESLIAQLTAKAVKDSQIAEAREKYAKHMNVFPLPENQPHIGRLDPVCYLNRNLHAFLSQDPTAKRLLNHVLYLPKRIVNLKTHQFLAFGPSHRYERATDQWIEGSDLISFNGGTRELFIKWSDFILYVGTYKCHDLRTLCPAGTNPPKEISEREIADAALGVPRPQKYIDIIKECYPDGKIKVVATGLQCVGFNHELYDSLRRQFNHDRALEAKRKAEDQGSRDTKRRKD